MSDPVQLTDLDTITRYSIAVRKASADRDELIETLRADLAWLERGLRRTRPSAFEVEEPEADTYDGVEETAAVEPDPAPEPEPPRAPLRRMPVKVTPAPRRTPAKKTATKTAAKKAAAKKTTTRRTAR